MGEFGGLAVHVAGEDGVRSAASCTQPMSNRSCAAVGFGKPSCSWLWASMAPMSSPVTSH